MADRICALEDCEDPRHSRGLCIRHYRKLQKYGDPRAGREYKRTGFPARDRSTTERFWAKVDKTDTCWPWRAALNENGYGVWNVRQAADEFGTNLAHRISWLLAGRELIDGFSLDHLCHTRDWTCTAGTECLHRRCVNPDHLEQVPGVVNTMRGRGFGPINKAKSHCDYGHPFSPENTYVQTSTGERFCRTCGRRRTRNYLARKAGVSMPM